MKMLSRQSRPSPARLSALGYKALRVIDCNDAIKEACRSSSPWRGRGPVTVFPTPLGCQVASPSVPLSMTNGRLTQFSSLS